MVLVVYSEELIAGVVNGATTQCWAWASCSGFETRGVLRREVVSPSPKLQTGELGLCVYDPRRQDGPDISLGIEQLGTSCAPLHLLTIIVSR